MKPLQQALFAPDATTRGADDAMAITLAGEAVELCALRALHWPRMRTLFVADVHFGKDAAFRAGGIPLPSGAVATDLARLTALLNATCATTLVVLGDLIHAASGRVPSVERAVAQWREHHAALDMLLIRGNHDGHAGDPPASWRIRTVAEPHRLAPFVACHVPQLPPSGYALCGHVHPGISIGGAAEPSVRLPCFVVGPRRAILPAFGRLTGLATGILCDGDAAIAIAGRRLVRLPGPST